MQAIPYLNFNGQCADAFAFYRDALGGEIVFSSRYGDSPMADEMPPDTRDRIMHCHLVADGAEIMGADGPPPHDLDGNTCVNLMVGTIEQAERVYAALSAGGAIFMPLQETFWAHRWCSFTDRFGKPWMINCMKQPG